MEERKRRLIAILVATSLVALAVAASGCVAHAHAGATVTASPQLVEIQPGVYVVEDYGTAVFYSDGAYWRHTGGVWYRSSYYDGGFMRVSYYGVPVRIRSIRRPSVYVRYRPAHRARRISARAHHRRAAHRASVRGEGRDHRRTVRTRHRANRADHRAVRNRTRKDKKKKRRR